jgi:hypothetical protein
LDTIPQPGEEHYLAVGALGEMWDSLLRGFFEPFVVSHYGDYAAVTTFDGVPHAPVFEEGIVTAVYCAGDRGVVGGTLCPKGN